MQRGQVIQPLTETYEFSPVPRTPVIIKNGPTSVWTTLPRPRRHGGGQCPPRLNAFTVRPPSPFGESKVEHHLTLGSVSREVKLRDENSPVYEDRQEEGGKSVVAVKPSLEVLEPLTSDVVSQQNPSDPKSQGQGEGRHECEVHIRIADRISGVVIVT